MNFTSIININSKNRVRQEDSTTNFSVSLRSINIQKVNTVKVKNVSFPNTAYNINITNNTFTYRDSTGYVSVYVNVGQYSLTQLLTALTTVLQGAINPITATFTVDPITKKINATASPAISFFDYDGANENILGEKLGISGLTGLVASHTFKNLSDMGGLSTIFIISDALNAHSGYIKRADYNAGTQSIVNTDYNLGIVDAFTINSGFGFDVVYKNEDIQNIIVYPNQRNLSSIDIRLTDEYNNTIDLNGVDVNIVLEITHN